LCRHYTVSDNTISLGTALLPTHPKSQNGHVKFTGMIP
jgi:hypothetical protein